MMEGLKAALEHVEELAGIWKNEAVSNIKKYFADAIMEMPEAISKRITIIG